MQIRHHIRTLGIALAAASTLWLHAQPAKHNPQAIRLNNNGVALMNQQQTERAESSFAKAFRLDPAFAEASMNEGIALLYLQKLPEAEAALQKSASA